MQHKAMAKRRPTANSQLINGLSDAVRNRRIELGLSQAQLAERAELHRTYISEVERGTQNLTIETMARLADALDTSIMSLMEAANLAGQVHANPLEILLAEDNEADVHLVERSLAAINVSTRLHVVMDGQEVMEFLERRGKHVEAPSPDLILLDLNLPRKSGHEILAELKSSTEFKHLPIVILTTSNSSMDLSKSYELHANTYVTKPPNRKEFQEAIAKVVDYWSGVARLPK